MHFLFWQIIAMQYMMGGKFQNKNNYQIHLLFVCQQRGYLSSQLHRNSRLVFLYYKRHKSYQICPPTEEREGGFSSLLFKKTFSLQLSFIFYICKMEKGWKEVSTKNLNH
jgi:hypothetical protein